VVHLFLRSMLRRLLLSGALFGVAAGAVLAVAAEPAVASPPSLNAARGVCQGTYGGLLVERETLVYECRFITRVPGQNGFTLARQQCESQYGGSFVVVDPTVYQCYAPVTP
jgi:hypothetical protein